MRKADPQLVRPEIVAARAARRGREKSPSRTKQRGPMPMEKDRMKTARHIIGTHPYPGPGLRWKKNPKQTMEMEQNDKLVKRRGLLFILPMIGVEMMVKKNITSPT